MYLDRTQFGCADVGNHAVTLTVSDVYGNASTCTSTVAVADTISPQAACRDVTVYLDGSGQYQLTAAELDDGSTDACGVDTVYLDRTQFACADVGNHAVTLTVEDVYGNASTCTSTVAVADTISPQAVCRDVTVYLDASGQYQLTAAELDDGSTDACGVDTAYLDRTAFACADVGNHAVTLIVEDVYGNASTCTSTVAVADTISPQAACRDVTVYLDGSGQYQLTAAELDDGSTDACGVDTVYLDRTQFGCADVGNHAVTLTVEDVYGNASTCTSTVAVADTISPQAACRDVTVYLDASGQYQLTAAELDDGSNDACGVDTAYLDRTAFGCADVGNHTVTLTVEDVYGNASTCTSTVAVADTIPPQAACRDVTVYLDASGQYQLTAAELNDGSNDACGVDTAYLDRTQFGCADVGNHTVTLTVEDVYGNASTCTSSVAVADTISPQARVGT